MCTVTFIPRDTGYYLAMNRDEQRTRVCALPPAIRRSGGRTAVYPGEPDGGTWIALNDSGASLALINWYAAPARIPGPAFSRGKVVRAASLARTAGDVARALKKLRLSRVKPFRLIGVFPATRSVVEWSWDGKTFARKQRGWKTRQWVSSGYDELEARCVRGRTFRALRRQRIVETLAWLRRAHRSHVPEPGPFSICMHRADAATVSYSEIAVGRTHGRLSYHAGAPCGAAPLVTERIRLAPISINVNPV